MTRDDYIEEEPIESDECIMCPTCRDWSTLEYYPLNEIYVCPMCGDEQEPD